ATLVPFALANESWARETYPYVYAVGSAALLLIRLFTPYTGSDLRQKRWYRIQSWSAIFFCVASFFLFYSPGQLRDWLAFTLAAAVIQVIASFAIKE
ncbi:MAG: hypothetical protein K2F79_06450, partial [Muribaculaceae bacterium]|nr:hypothetical protein [Muribaculaceae bacterium]